MSAIKSTIREEFHPGPDYLDQVAGELADAYLRSKQVSYREGPEEYRASAAELAKLSDKYARGKAVRTMVLETGQSIRALKRTRAVEVADQDLVLHDHKYGPGYDEQLAVVIAARERYEVVVKAIADGYV